MEHYNYTFTQDWNHILQRISSLLDSNNSQEAESLALSTLKSDPTNYNLLNAYGVVLQAQQRFEESAQVLEKAIELAPQDPSLWINISNTYMQLRNPERALMCVNEALKIDTNNVSTIHLKAKIYMHLTHYPQALKALQQALSISPKRADILRDKTMVLQYLKQLDESLEAPKDSDLKRNWDEVTQKIFSLITSNHLQEAEELAIITLKSDPNSTSLLNAYGIILQYQNRFEEAIKTLKKAIKSSPDDHIVWTNMGNIYLNWQNQKQALICFDKSLSIKPDQLPALVNKAKLLMNLTQHSQALEVLQKALSIASENSTILQIKAAALQHLKRYDELIETLEKLSALNPNDLEIIKGLGDLYSQLPWKMDYPKALRCYEMLYAANPNDLESLKRMCFILNSNTNLSDQDSLTKAHHLVNKLLETAPLNHDFSHIVQNIALRSLDYDLYDKMAPFKELLGYWAAQGSLKILAYQSTRIKTMQDRLDLVETFQRVNNTPPKPPLKRRIRQKLNNKTRFGIISPNLRNNCVGYFIWPLIEHLDKSKFELCCYSMASNQNCSLEPNIIKKSDLFRKYDATTDNITAQSIADDGVDVLLEISAITYQSSILAAKPAPIQLSWLDSCSSLGLPPAVDYLDYVVVDPYIQPSHPDFAIKRPLMMPHTWVTLSSNQPPLLYEINNITPQERNGYITFGTINSILKLNRETIAVWAQIMHMVPDSRFLYVRPEMAAQITRDNFCKHMESHGISRDRISFVATNGGHLAQFNNIDIALDTFPQTGGTTTCEAIMMGVPLVSLVGVCLFERISYSNLTNVGLGDLCAFSIEEYQDIAVKLSQDQERRRHLRSNLRRQTLQSPLGDSKQFVADFSSALMNLVGRG